MSATAAGADRMPQALLFGVVAAVLGAMPGWLHGGGGLDVWSLVNAAAAIALAFTGPAPRCEHGALFACVAATCLGMALDFERVAPQALATLCSNDAAAGWGGNAMASHLRLFPATSICMLLLILQRGGLFSWATAARAMAALPQLGLRFGAMLALMALTMQAFRLLAWSQGWSWGAHGMVSAMIVSMFLYILLMQIVNEE